MSQVTYFEWGGAIVSNLDQVQTQVRELHDACVANTSCTVLEVRKDVDRATQSILADFSDGTFDRDNTLGIQRVERLALTHNPSSDFPWEVRALRLDFPITNFQNAVPLGEPCSICLYNEPWVSLERTWSKESFLKRIFWWLRSTAEECIQDDEHPLEQLFFSSRYRILLPEDHFALEQNLARLLSFKDIVNQQKNVVTLVGCYVDQELDGYVNHLAVSLILDPLEDGPIEQPPQTLGELEALLNTRQSNIKEKLKEKIFESVSEKGLDANQAVQERVLLTVGVPRARNGNIVSWDAEGFFVDSDLGKLGEALSVLFHSKDDNRWYREYGEQVGHDDWMSIKLEQVNVKCYPTGEQIRQLSGLPELDPGPSGILAGVGALGGLVAEIWAREKWGKWSYVDDDIVEAHNVVRHIASRSMIGHSKAKVVSLLTELIHTDDVVSKSVEASFSCSIDSDCDDVRAQIHQSNLIVDITTTLQIPRWLSRQDDFPRVVSAFITPSGLASVMLMEDADRTVRCNSLEAQYYRAILTSNWGRYHLAGHSGRLWVGGGCRDVTFTISNELIHLHASVLARQIRKRVEGADAKICVWDCNDDEGSLALHEVAVCKQFSHKFSKWEVFWDAGFIEEASALRRFALPNETGGIVLGIVDQKDLSITLVKACEPPTGSVGTFTGFARAAYSSTEFIDECRDRTGGTVIYVGEWHSHPNEICPAPSKDDQVQFRSVSTSQQLDGYPALMLIVSEDSFSLSVGEQSVQFPMVSLPKH